MKKLLIDPKGKKTLVEDAEELHTSRGVIKNPKNGPVKTHLGTTYYLTDPTIVDYVDKMPKAAQIIYPKDAAMIIGLTGLSNGSKVVEAGVGVAGLTTLLANSIQPKGKVYSYEIREDHIKKAKENLESCGLLKYVDIKNRSIYDGIDEENVDVVILDLPEPWLAIEPALRALRVGGFLVSYSPSIEQTKKFATALTPHFPEANTMEVLVRDWEVSKQRCRPKTRMIAHTGFITIARKLTE